MNQGPRKNSAWATSTPRLEERSEERTNVRERINERQREKMVYNLARTTSIAFTVVETFDVVCLHVYEHAQYRRFLRFCRWKRHLPRLSFSSFAMGHDRATLN